MLDSNLIPMTVLYALVIASIVLLVTRMKRMKDE